MPINPDLIIKHLESHLPPEPELQIWTGDKKADRSTPTPPSTPSSSSSYQKPLINSSIILIRLRRLWQSYIIIIKLCLQSSWRILARSSQGALPRQSLALNIRMIWLIYTSPLSTEINLEVANRCRALVMRVFQQLEMLITVYRLERRKRRQKRCGKHLKNLEISQQHSDSYKGK